MRHDTPPTSPYTKCSKGRPSTPYPTGESSFSGRAFNFDSDHSDYHASQPVKGCIGMSLAEILNTFHSPSSRPTSPLSVHEDDGSFYPSPFFPESFNKFRKMVQKTISNKLKSLSCPSNSNLSMRPVNGDRRADISLLSDSGTFEGEMDKGDCLLQRATSWNTLETLPTNENANGDLNYLNNDNDPNQGKEKGVKCSHSKHVQFQYPPITSIRLRPRTQSNEINQLFFATKELEQIEDDRLDTKVADDVETLVVGASNEWNSMATCTSSTVTASVDENDPSKLLFIGDGASNVMFDSSPRAKVRSPINNSCCKGSKRFVQGVQIMLREKSLG